ncbi:MAG: hypothetical protein ACI4E1_14510 [Lachnospira sp.]
MSFVSGLSSNLNTSYADTYDAKATALNNKLDSTDFSKASDEELMSVCKDFESYFVEQVLKSMQKMAQIGDDDENSSLFNSMAMINSESDAGTSTLSNYYGDEMISSFAEILTESQGGSGLGIAQMLYEQMKRNYDITSKG